MTIASQSVGKIESPFTSAFGFSIGFILLLSFFLNQLGVPLVPLALVFGSAVCLWLVFRHPVGSLGLFLAVMPLYPLTFLLGKFFEPSYATFLAGCDRVGLLLLTCLLLCRNRITLTTPDWFLMAAFFMAVVRLSFDGTVLPLLSDFNFIIAYAAGRVTILTPQQEKSWAKRAVWIVALLSVVGMGEVFLIGDAPRTLLYLSVAEGATDAKGLNATFHADGFVGLRESSTMFGPLQFASLCLAAVVFWWVYCRNPLAAVMVAAGLICSLTRSAWMGTAVAISALAVLMRNAKRLLLFGVLFLSLLAASLPLLGLGDFLTRNKTGEDYSMQGHKESILDGLKFIAEHPFGVGPGNAGSYATKENANGVFIENTYETLAAEYGILTSICFLGFIVSALITSWRIRREIGYVAFGILVGFATVIFVSPMHQDFNLATWIWFPVGLAVRSSLASKGAQASATSLGTSS